MKILFDANTPAPLARFLRGHEVARADELLKGGGIKMPAFGAATGWAGLNYDLPPAGVIQISR